ncbi:MAG: hypothetical protein NC408_01495 [Candidatus Gastranaerophilales bacterium]|nr:hypothetical protein [Candidatus Gastranaerophilales bacterium]MCM1072207.1 hypothetical protein [Bacteroides sp.]
MFNNINDNNKDFLYNSQLEKQSNVINLASVKASMNKALFNKSSNPYVDKTEISANALQLFQKDLDINKFNKIATSDKEDLSHLERMKELFSNGVVDVFEDDVLSQLVTNSKLWDDLEL